MMDNERLIADLRHQMASQRVCNFVIERKEVRSKSTFHSHEIRILIFDKDIFISLTGILWTNLFRFDIAFKNDLLCGFNFNFAFHITSYIYSKILIIQTPIILSNQWSRFSWLNIIASSIVLSSFSACFYFVSQDDNASLISLQQSLESTRAHLQKQLRTKDADCNRMAVQIRVSLVLVASNNVQNVNARNKTEEMVHYIT